MHVLYGMKSDIMIPLISCRATESADGNTTLSTGPPVFARRFDPRPWRMGRAALAFSIYASDRRPPVDVFLSVLARPDRHGPPFCGLFASTVSVHTACEFGCGSPPGHLVRHIFFHTGVAPVRPRADLSVSDPPADRFYPGRVAAPSSGAKPMATLIQNTWKG